MGEPMSQVNWLHLSDWHQGRPGFDRKVILTRLIEDIQARREIDERLDKIDFIVFSGDIADHGTKEQFDLATTQLLNPIRQILGKDIPIYSVPGNHDIQRPDILTIPAEWAATFAGGAKDKSSINDLMQDPAVLLTINKPLSNYYQFAANHGCKYDQNTLHFNALYEKDGHKIGIVCLNTAWHSARFEIQPVAKKTNAEVWDHGVLRITEAQITDALEKMGDVDIAIAIMHHPLYWLEEFEQAKVEQMIGQRCHIVLHGHEHRPNMSRLSNAFGDVVTIPAGASYNRRVAEDPRYTNAYNFCSVDLESKVGTIFHRIWSEEHNTWRADIRFWAEGQSLFFIQRKQTIEQQRTARKALNHLSRNYLPHAYRRTAISHVIDVRHELKPIGDEKFIKAIVRIAIKLHPGDLEDFPVKSLVNRRIVGHPNPDVRKEAYRLIKLSPPAIDGGKWKDGSTFEGTCQIGPKDTDIAYEYEMLETMEGFYYFSLRRFTENVAFTLIKEPTLEYEDMAFGGFPSLQSVNDKIFRADTWKTYELSMPNQGLLIQWYPKAAIAVPQTA
jgi:predicted phosphodiesterase